MTRSTRAGLTFVELLMAATIFAILAVGFSAHLRGGVLAWRRATSTLERLQEIRVVYDRLGSDLTNAIVFDPSGVWQPEMAFGTEAIPVESLQWELESTTGIGTTPTLRRYVPFELTPSLVYISGAGEATGTTVQFHFKYALTIPEEQVSGTYQTTIRFTLTEVL